MNEIELFLWLCREYGSHKFLINHIPFEYQEELHNLKNMGLWYDAGKDESITCDQCDEPHFAYLKKFPHGLYGWRCPDTGFHEFDDVDIQKNQGKLNIDQFIDKVRNLIGIKRNLGNFVTNIDGLYTLGKLGNEIFEGEFYIYIKNQHPMTNNELYSFLSTRLRPNLGIVLCIDNDIEAREYALPNSHYLMPIADIFSIQDNEFFFEIKNINQFLPINKHISFNKTVGRPTDQEMIENIFTRLANENYFLNKTVKEQAQIIHKEMGNPSSPKKKTISNKISKMKNAQNHAQNSNLG